MAVSEEVRFVILSTARSGTNLLIELLNSHPDCLCAYEIFSRTHVANHDIPWPLEGLADVEALCALRLSDPVALIERLDGLTRERGYRAVGFKLMYIEAEEVPDVRDYVQRTTDLRIIHVHRRNALRRLVSLRRAERTGDWVIRQAQRTDKPPAVRLSLWDLANDFEYNRAQEQRYASLDETHQVLHLTYEDMIVDLSATAQELWNFLGLRAWDKWNAGTLRTGTDPLREAIANYDELKALADELASFFEKDPA